MARSGRPTDRTIADRSDNRYRTTRAAFRAKCEKYDVPCHLCSQPIDYTVADGSTGYSFECDHYHPVSTHPHLIADPANYRASHKKCNAERGNKPVRPVLGLPSRKW